MSTPILEMKNITKTFPGVKALDDVSFRVAADEIHCLVGENGAGKSTLMKVLSGVYPHGTYTGDILYNGQVQQFRGIADSDKAGAPRRVDRAVGEAVVSDNAQSLATNDIGLCAASLQVDQRIALQELVEGFLAAIECVNLVRGIELLDRRIGFV